MIEKVVRATALVESESQDGAFYQVELDEDSATCSCPDYQKRGNACKHIQAVRGELRA